jgi:hypothetical protein
MQPHLLSGCGTAAVPGALQLEELAERRFRAAQEALRREAQEGKGAYDFDQTKADMSFADLFKQVKLRVRMCGTRLHNLVSSSSHTWACTQQHACAACRCAAKTSAAISASWAPRASS